MCSPNTRPDHPAAYAAMVLVIALIGLYPTAMEELPIVRLAGDLAPADAGGEGTDVGR